MNGIGREFFKFELMVVLVCGLAFAAAPAAADEQRGYEEGEYGPVPGPEYTAAVNEQAKRVCLSYQNGLWGSKFAQALRIDLPFGPKLGRYLGADVRGLFVHTDGDPTLDYDPLIGLDVGFFGRGPVLFGVIRLYGGGGLIVGIRPGSGVTDRVKISGGGHLGVEFFASPYQSFAIEIGGQGPGHATGEDGGASVMGIMNVYPGRAR